MAWLFSSRGPRSWLDYIEKILGFNDGRSPHRVLDAVSTYLAGDDFPSTEGRDGNLSSDPFNDDSHLFLGAELPSGHLFGAA